MRIRPLLLGATLGCAALGLSVGLWAGSPAGAPATGAAEPPIPDTLPDLPVKPTPSKTTINGCPFDGDAVGDQDLNALKNRDDVAEKWFPVSFHAIHDLPWPRSVEQKKRRDWRPTALIQVQR